MLQKALICLIGFLIFFFFLGLGRQLYSAMQSSKRLDAAADVFTKTQKKNLELKKKLAQSQSTAFIEEQARDKLNLARDGETVVVIPQEEIDRVVASYQTEPVVVVPNWKKWLALIFH